ncbi:MAG TPA: hypothetical protein VMG10_03300 [Gemmataceae bacterium]|nr:hypothetical protein [Gemmataceae bacterium]
MQFLAPDILEEAKGISPFLSGAGMTIGFLLWSFGGRTHRFWLAMSVTLTAGLLGLTLGKQYGMQPLVAGLLLAVSAGALALSLVRILLFAAGGLAALGLIHTLASTWDEPIAVFLVGGLVGVLLYRFWIITFSSLIGTLFMAYSALALFDRLHMVDSVAFTQKNGPLLNWGCAALVVVGILVQFLLERRRRRKAEPAAEPEVVEVAPPPPPPPPAKPAPAGLWAWGEKWLHRRAG